MKNVLKMKKSFLKWRAKNRNLFFAIAVLLLLFISLQGQLNQLYAADKTEVSQKETTYPETPEGVVDAFIKADFEGARKNRWGLSKSAALLKKYAILSLKHPDVITSTIVSNYKVTKLKETDKTAEAEVEYTVAGRLLEDFWGVGWADLNKIAEVYRIAVVKEGNYWKMKVPYELEPHISVEVAIKRLEKILEIGSSIDKEKEMEKRNQIISMLRKHAEISSLLPYILQPYDIKQEYFLSVPTGIWRYHSQKSFKKTHIPYSKDYPPTPEGVVEAFIRADFDDEWEQRKKFAIYVVAPSGETALISDYKITKISEDSDKALVKAEYKIAGYFSRSERGLHFRKSRGTDETYVFELIKQNGFWQIKSPFDHQYELIETKIKSMGKVREWYSQREKSQAQQIIKSLKDILRR